MQFETLLLIKRLCGEEQQMRMAAGMRLFFLAAIWGASFLFMRIAVPFFGVFNTAFLRVLFGAVGLLALLLILRIPYRFAGQLKAVAFIGVINSGLPFGLYCIAAQYLPTGYSATLNATTPLMGAIIGFAFFGETLSWRKWLGVGAGIIGVALIIPHGALAADNKVAIGVLTCLLATACYAIASFLTKRWITDCVKLDSRVIALGSQLGATVFLLPFCLSSIVVSPPLAWPPLEAWLCVITLGLLCTALAYILYFSLLNDIGPLQTLSVTFLIPPFGALWGYLVLGETLSPKAIVGALVVGLAVWLVLARDPIGVRKLR